MSSLSSLFYFDMYPTLFCGTRQKAGLRNFTVFIFVMTIPDCTYHMPELLAAAHSSTCSSRQSVSQLQLYNFGMGMALAGS